MVRAIVFACAALLTQTSVAQSSFEVASVKVADPDSGAPGSNVMRGGPGTGDPGRITFISVTMKRLLMVAYGVGDDQISGPGWLDSQRYAIVAKVPAGSDRQQLLKMLQNLLAERFNLRVHHELKDSSGYELVVAKGGPKLEGNVTAKNGFPQALPGRYAAASAEPGVSRLTFNTCSISDLVGALGFPLSAMTGKILSPARVVDRTGLTGKYNFTLEFAGYMGPGGALTDTPGGIAPTLFVALEKQLGLKLTEKRISLETLVIDHVEKVPTPD